MPKNKRNLPGGLPMGIGGAIRLLPMLWKYGHLSFSLMQDARVPTYAKVVLIAGAALVLSPLDLIPESIPVLGQISDLFFLLLLIQVFLRLIPLAVVEEHIEKLGLQGQVRVLFRPR